MRQEISLSDDELESRFSKLTGIGLCFDDIEYTRETLANLHEARRQWRQPGRVTVQTDDSLVVEGCQALKGQSRSTLAVIDFGEVRALFQI